MLRPSPARDASTCLRCHLRLVLRQIHQRRYQSTDTDHPSPPAIRQHLSDASENKTGYRVFRPHGAKVRGKKGGQRRVESAEPLAIKSLGLSSEVIVLRDLNEPRKKKHDKPQEQPTEPVESAEPGAAPSLTAKDIENYSSRRTPRPPPAEVFESIESIKPEYGSHVLSRKEFEEKSAALAKGYSIGQLRGYLFSKSNLPSASNEAVRSPGDPAKLDVTEISSTHGDLQDLKRTPWHPGTSSPKVRLPVERGIVRQVQMGRKMNNKQFVTESILRDAWAVVVEEEEAAIGEMEFLLTPMQFGLLLTKNSNTLRPLLESSKFYQNSRFQLYQPDHIIRIIGPRAETEAIASVLADAYASARSAEIALDTVDAMIHQNSSTTTLQDIFDKRHLSHIMDLTRTYIQYDDESKRLRIASFVDKAINDAHRLLMALLPLPTRNVSRVLYDDLEGEECRLEMALTSKTLPFRTKYQNLGRWVTPSRKVAKSAGTGSDAAVSEEADVPGPAEKNKLAPAKQTSLLAHNRPVVQKAIKAMEAKPTSLPYHRIAKSYWQPQAQSNLWEAKIGYLLHDTHSSVYPGVSSDAVSVDSSRQNAVFSPQSPNLFALLSMSRMQEETNSKQPDDSTDSNTELIARLIPSPLEATGGVLASTAFPTVLVRFRIHNRMFRASTLPASKRAFAMKLDDGKEVVFKDMCAILNHETVELNLPAHPVDLKFDRQNILMSSYAEEDTQIKDFVRAIQLSMVHDTALRAPPALQLRIPKWAVKVKSLEEVPQEMKDAAKQIWGRVYHASDEVPVKYLFAGFEHREKRSLMVDNVPDHQLRVETVEAGVTGGRRVELSLIKRRDVSVTATDRKQKQRVKDDCRGLVKASVDLVNYLTRIQRGEVRFTVSKEKAMEMYHAEKSKMVKAGVNEVVNQETGVEEAESERRLQEPDQGKAGMVAEERQKLEGVEKIEESVEAAQELDMVAKQEEGVKQGTEQDPRTESVTEEPTLEKKLEQKVAEETQQPEVEAEQEPVKKEEDEPTAVEAQNPTSDKTTDLEQKAAEEAEQNAAEELQKPEQEPEKKVEGEQPTAQPRQKREELPLSARLSALLGRRY